MLSGTPLRGYSVVERQKEGLRLTTAGPSAKRAGCILDPARVDVQNVKCDCARGRSGFFNDGSDRAEGRAPFFTGGCIRAGGQPAFSTGGRDRAEDRPLVEPVGAFVQSLGRIFVPVRAIPQRAGWHY
jgi:hypothetical protein